ncbi:MAG: molybdopterin-dependent oxidoreductase [Candidatus Bathyarchaeota archaeon]|nr:molybdopterin-dependent oxidoreductase [Candidatus Bathyarchaeota archaeon]
MNKKQRITIIFLATIALTIAENGVHAQIPTTNYKITYQSLVDMPKITVYAELYCDGFLLTGADWSGVQLSYLLNYLHADSEANSVQFVASDGYTVTIPIQLAKAPQTLIAYEINGQPLPEELRLILPDYNGAAWISHIVYLSVSDAVVPNPALISVGGGMLRNTVSDLNTNPAPTPTPASVSSPSSHTSATPSNTGASPPATSPSPTPLNSVAAYPEPTYQSVGQQPTIFAPSLMVSVIAVLLVCFAVGILLSRRRKN